MESPLSICNPEQLNEWINSKTTPSFVILDVISSAVPPTNTIPTAKCVRMNTFDIYRYENDIDSDTKHGDDDPSDSGKVQSPSRKTNNKTLSIKPNLPTMNLPTMTYGNFNIRPKDQLKHAVEALGITQNTRVVVFTQNFKAGVSSPITAARMAWILCYCGVLDVKILNGGFGAWKANNYPTINVTSIEDHATISSTATHRVNFGSNIFPARPDFLACTEDVLQIVQKNQNGVLADARSWDEYTGKSHGYNFDLGCGRIPGARWAHWGPSTYCGGDFSVADAVGKLQDLSEIEKFWKEWNIIVPDEKKENQNRTIVFYCGSGWRSAMAWVMSQLLGLKNCSSYDGSFLEWNKLHPNAENHLIETGQPSDYNQKQEQEQEQQQQQQQQQQQRQQDTKT